MSGRRAWTAPLGVLVIVLGVACGWPSSPPDAAAPKELTPAQRYAEDCAATLGYVALSPEVSADESECDRLEIDQSCAPDLSGCDASAERCREACTPACSTCRAGCVASCDGCKAGCAAGDAACQLACGEARAACQVDCLVGREPCLSACGEAWGVCNQAFEAERARLCPDCARIERCSFGAPAEGEVCPGPDGEASARFPGNDPRCLDWCVGW